MQEAILDKKVQFSSLNTSNALMIDELVRMNTDAEKELKGILSQNGFYPYNFMFTKLKENLAKRIWHKMKYSMYASWREAGQQASLLSMTGVLNNKQIYRKDWIGYVGKKIE